MDHIEGPGPALAAVARARPLHADIERIARALEAAVEGDLRGHARLDVQHPLARVGAAAEQSIARSRQFAHEIARVCRRVAIDGRLSERANPSILPGDYGEALSAFNDLLDLLTWHAGETAAVARALEQGELSRTMSLESPEGAPLRGKSLRVARSMNALVSRLRAIRTEVIRIAGEVGTAGRLGGQAQVPGASGAWKELVDAVNLLAANLTSQVRNIALVTTAVARGDLSQKISVPAQGEILELKETVNEMVDQLRAFAAEVTRVAREVGMEGKLGGQADVKGVSGVWKDLTDNVNSMASNLTTQVRSIVKVVTAVANGDLNGKLQVNAQGEIAALGETLNDMTRTLSIFAQQVTSVARTVGVEGKLGAQADVPGVAGTWKDLTENVNLLANNLTAQVRNIAEVTTAVARGDLSRKISVPAQGEILELKETINEMVDQLRSFAGEVTRVAREVGTEGKLGGQADVKGVSGTWKDLTDNVNILAGNLTDQVRNIAKVTTAVAHGDLSQKITVDVRGEVLALKNTINTMVDQLRSFASEVTRVAREVGTEGRLGAQADVRGVAGVWKDLTDNVNVLARNLTDQVRNIALVTTAVARGDLSRKITVSAQGEILDLKETVNEMVDQLRAFAAEVTRVAREVGTEGKLGGQAQVPGVAGTWKDLTESVNTLAGNLTSQVRNIALVTTAVANGELSRKITVHARGEIRELKATVNAMVDQLRAFTAEVIRVTREVGSQGKLGGQANVPGMAGSWKDLTDSINEMIVDLRQSTQANEEQDWLNTNLAHVSGLLQGRRSLEELGRIVLGELAPQVCAQYASLFVAEGAGAGQSLRRVSTYGHPGEGAPERFAPGEGLVGQCALEKRIIAVDELPADYLRIRSSIGEAAPSSLLVVPVLFEGEVRGVVELGSLPGFRPIHRVLLEKLADGIGVVLNTIATTSRTEHLLEELQASNAELAKRTSDLEDKARQLALVSRYKSEFLANMSHELRTPLNSILILARLLSENPQGRLDAEEVQYASTIHSSGQDLLTLINQILDLSRIEAGKLQVDVQPVEPRVVGRIMERMFRPTLPQGIEFLVSFSPKVPETILTDSHRLQQVLKNLLSNAFKFTPAGRVELSVDVEPGGDHFHGAALRSGREVLAFAVSDTGIGIPPEKHELIFEAFEQADASTRRTFGGTGLGLTISRELARLLGGEIRLRSSPGGGSTFTLYLPVSLPTEAPAPLVLPEPPSPPPSVAPASKSELRGTTVVLVDDDVHNLFAVTTLLERYGARVLPATDARECFQLLAANPRVDVVLMDVMMPEIDGLEATRRIRRRPEYESLPIVALTAKALPGDRERCLEAGCSDFATKPVNPDTLIALISKWKGAGHGTQ
jgi:signal transduction histidine kinase/HAMP domain-containing protein/CheY-like chemotaxis protein